MKKSISILMVALLATGMSLTAQNRGNGAPMGDGARMGNPGMGMMKALNLTEDQKAKLQVLHQGFAKKDSVSMVELKKQREAVRAQRQSEMAKILTPEQLLQLDKIRVENGQKAGMKGQFGRGNGQQGIRQGGFARQGRGQMMVQGRGKMMAQGRGQMMQRGRGKMMVQGRGQMNRGGLQMRRAIAYQGKAKHMNAATRVNPEIRIKNQVERMTKQLDLTPEQATKIQTIQLKDAKKEIATYQEFQKNQDAKLKQRNAKQDEIKAVLTPDQVKKLDALKEKAPRMERKNGPMKGRN